MAKLNVPTLRFKGFDGDWKSVTLGGISKNVMYGMNSSAIAFDGTNQYLRITDIDEESRQFKPKPLSSPDGVIEDKFKLTLGDIVFARTGASVGKSYLYKKEDGILLFAGFLIKFSITNADTYFIYSNTFGYKYQNWLRLMSMRSGQPGINAEEYKSYKFLLPTLPEQQKIASFLTAVDEKVQLLNKKKELLTKYKKGVMQKLFSKEIRFNDDEGNNYEDWEEKSLSDLVVIKYGKDQKQVISDTGIYPILGTGGEIGKTDHYLYDKPSVLIGRKGTIDRPRYMNSPFWTVDTLFYTEILKGNNPKWLFYQFQTINWYLYNEASGVPSLSASTIYKIKIDTPSYEEQTKIANFLSSLDEKIETVNHQVSHSKDYKKGLLQQMFV